MNTPAPETSPRPRPLLPRRISPAAIARYQQCPRAVYYQYVAKVPRRERPSAHLMLGNAVHAALAKFFGLSLEDRTPTVDVLHRCLRAVWKQHRRSYAFDAVEEERFYGENGLEMLSTFARRFDTDAAPLARERWVSTRLRNGVDLVGRVDRVDDKGAGAIDVLDYKTGREILDIDELADEPAAQVYLLASESEFSRRVRRVRYVYLAAGVETIWEPDREDVDIARHRLEAITWEMFTDTTFEASPGDHCARCPFAHACPDAGRVQLTNREVSDDIAF